MRLGSTQVNCSKRRSNTSTSLPAIQRRTSPLPSSPSSIRPGRIGWEYDPIAPVLNSANFSCLAVNARHGGAMWGHENETVVHLGHEGNYPESIVDLEAALAWARKQNPFLKLTQASRRLIEFEG